MAGVAADGQAADELGKVRLGVPIRNPNYLKLAISWFVVGAAALAVNAISSFRLRELGVFILAGPLLLSAFELLKWQRVTLGPDSTGVTEHRLLTRRTIAWSEIDRFEISDPVDRTPLMLSFAWWADRCAVRLVGGRRHSIPAVQPYHGFTILSVLNLRRWTSADVIVDELNAMVRGSRAEHGRATADGPT